MHVNFFNDEKNMKNKYWKYICLLGLGAFCWACSDDNPDGGQNSGEPGYEGGQGTEQEITRSYKLGTLAGFEGEIRKQMDRSYTDASTMYNRSLFYRYVESAFPGQAGEQDPLPSNITEQDWWDNFVEEIAYSGQDYVAMNCRGMANDNVDHGRPDKLLDLMAAIERKGVAHKFKIAIFDDTPASWAAARNAHKGFGYADKPMNGPNRYIGSEYPLLFMDPEKEDAKGEGNKFRNDIYQYIWDFNLKKAFEYVPREYWFEIDGRPVIYFWNPNGFLQDSYLGELTEQDPDNYKSTTGLDYTKADAYNGKLSYILKCLSDDFNEEYGVRPFLIIQREWTDRDFSLVNCPYVDAIHNWFAAPLSKVGMTEEEKKQFEEEMKYNTYVSAYNFKGFSVGSGCPGFVQGDRSQTQWQFIDARHGEYATEMFESFLTFKPNLVFLEGFTDGVENAAWWRSMDKTYYDYPNQRINLLRKYGNHPFPTEQKLEAEACDYCYQGTISDKKIESSQQEDKMNNAPEQYVVKRCSDTKYTGGWHTDLTADGLNALRWKELPFRSGESIIRFRYASEGEITVCCQIGNEMTQKVTLPATGNAWEETEVAVYTRDTRGYADFNLAVIEGAISLNYVEIITNK